MGGDWIMTFRDWVYYGPWEVYTRKLQTLATDELPLEKWSYAGKNDYGILRNYISFTFEKLWQEREEAEESDKQSIIYMDENVACFNTGLFDKNWQPIYFFCEKNPVEGKSPWRFKSFFNGYTINYVNIPTAAVQKLRRANYFTNPSLLIFDVNLNIIPQWNHILDDEENFNRIPEQIRYNGRDVCYRIINGSIGDIKKRIEANYKTIVPQYYKGKIQLLAPLYLTAKDKPDLALVLSLSDDKSAYMGHTCLTTEMAYNNARLIARPDSDWLHP